jgi:hypothetical protein
MIADKDDYGRITFDANKMNNGNEQKNIRILFSSMSMGDLVVIKSVHVISLVFKDISIISNSHRRCRSPHQEPLPLLR